MIETTEKWRSTHPGAAMGILAFSDIHPVTTPQLDQKRKRLEIQLHDRYKGMSRSDILQLPVMAAYAAYYKRFKKTYHLLLQLESIVIKGKKIPKPPPLVEAMFLAELESLILTAGHDLEIVERPVTLDSAIGDESYTQLRGNEVVCKSGDMVMADPRGVICSIIYGQDQRTQITAKTQQVIYATYVPPGIDSNQIEDHLSELEQNVVLISPAAQLTFRNIYFAD
jgi:DNA/RNA-binding domain of Phe-tRNA-synthetase-like protein